MTSPAGYRIRFQPGIGVPGLTYGSGRYGAGIYGQKASDAVGSLRYRVLAVNPIPPFPGGASSMADPDITVIRGDSLPTLTVQIVGDNDQPLLLDDIDTQVYFHMRPTDGAETDIITGGCAIVSETDGIVNFDWSPSTTAVAGEYVGEFEIVYASGRRLTVPTIGKLQLHIPDDIGPAFDAA